MSSLAQKMSSMDSKIILLEQHVGDCNGKVIEIEASRSHDSAVCDEILSKQRAFKKSMKDENVKCDRLSEDFARLKAENVRLNEELLDLQSRSMRENLLFFNFAEEAMSDDRKNEDCSSKIVKFCSNDLNIEGVKIDRAHRIGRFKPGATRPIVAKFHSPAIKKKVKKLHMSKKSRPIMVLVNNILSNSRQAQVTNTLDAKSSYIKKQAVLDRDKLFIDNKMYTVNSLPIRELEHVVVPQNDRAQQTGSGTHAPAPEIMPEH